MGDADEPDAVVRSTPRPMRSTKNGLSTPAENVCSHRRLRAFRMDTTNPRDRSGQQSALKKAMSTVSSTSSGKGTSAEYTSGSIEGSMERMVPACSSHTVSLSMSTVRPSGVAMGTP